MSTTLEKNIHGVYDELAEAYPDGRTFRIKRGNIPVTIPKEEGDVVIGGVAWLRVGELEPDYRSYRGWGYCSLVMVHPVIEETELLRFQRYQGVHNKYYHYEPEPASINAVRFEGQLQVDSENIAVAGLHIFGALNAGALRIVGAEAAEAFSGTLKVN